MTRHGPGAAGAHPPDDREAPDIDELARYLDGEVSENRAAAIRDHLAACPGCRDALERERRLVHDIAAPVAGPDPALVDRLVRRLDAAPARRVAPAWLLPGGAAVAALAAVALVMLAWPVRHPGEAGDPGELTPRGAVYTGRTDRAAIARHVGLAVHSLSPVRARLDAGSRVAPGTAYALSYRNHHGEPLYLLAFAVDARGTVHWLAPAYLDASTDPAAAPLPASDREIMLSDAVVFDDVPPGRLRIVTIASPVRRRISEIERLSAAELARDALEARWTDASVHEVVLEVAAGGVP